MPHIAAQKTVFYAIVHISLIIKYLPNKRKAIIEATLASLQNGRL